MRTCLIVISLIASLLFAPEMRAQSTSQPAAKPAAPAGQAAAPAKPAAPAVSALTDTGWPRTIVSNTTKIVVYQPQINAWDGFRLDARAAVAVTAKADAPPVFGIVEVSANTLVDKDAGLVTLDKIAVKNASFPGHDAEAKTWSTAIQTHAARLKPIASNAFRPHWP